MKKSGVFIVLIVLSLVLTVSVVSAAGVGSWWGKITGKITDDYNSPVMTFSGDSKQGLVGGASIVNGGIDRSSLRVDGKTGYYSSTWSGAHPTKALSVAGWFRTESFKTENNEITGSWVSKRNSYVLDAEPDGRVIFWLYLNDGWSYTSSPPNSISLNTWEHWTGTWDWKMISLYKNGILVASTPATGTLGTSGDVCIGHDCGLAAPYDNRYFQGNIDEVRVYTDALSNTAVEKLYNADKSNLIISSDSGSGGGGSGGSGFLFNYSNGDRELVVSINESGESYQLRLTDFANWDGTNKVNIQKYADGSWVEVCNDRNAGDTCTLGSVTLTISTISPHPDRAVMLSTSSTKGTVKISRPTSQGGSGGSSGGGGNSSQNVCAAVGCSVENRCLPYGTRVGGRFCDLKGNMQAQETTGIACENNYECSSNVCASGQCVDAGLFQKIIDFFKKIIGSGDAPGKIENPPKEDKPVTIPPDEPSPATGDSQTGCFKDGECYRCKRNDILLSQACYDLSDCKEQCSRLLSISCHSDIECDDSSKETYDFCSRPGTEDAECRHEQSSLLQEVLINGKPEDKIDVLFIGLSFESAEAFDKNVLEHIDLEGKHKGILYFEPFKSNKNKFNFYKIEKMPPTLEENFLSNKCYLALQNNVLNYPCIKEAKNWLSQIATPYDHAIIIWDNKDPEITGGWAESLAGGVLALTISREHPPFDDQGHIETVHEFAHLLGLTDQKIVKSEFFGYGVSIKDQPNCDTDGCPKWCTDSQKEPSGVSYLYCKDLSESACKSDNNCFWRTQVDSFYKTQCVPFRDSTNRGIGCLEGTGCYYNCNGVGTWRSSNYVYEDGLSKSTSLMFYMQNAKGFDAVDQRFLNSVLARYK